MKIRELVKSWSKDTPMRPSHSFNVSLDDRTTARIYALQDMYPGHSTQAIIEDLIGAALGELESSFPYVPGDKVVATDELGDPLYEDVGPTPKYLALSKKHMQSLKAKLN